MGGAKPPGVKASIKNLKESLHNATATVMLTRTHFELPLSDDDATQFATENVTRGKKTRIAGRQGRNAVKENNGSQKPDAAQGKSTKKTTATDEEAAAAAEDKANELLQLEEQARVKKD